MQAPAEAGEGEEGDDAGLQDTGGKDCNDWVRTTHIHMFIRSSC